MRADRLTEADDFDDHKRDLMALKCRQFEQRLPEIAATTDAELSSKRGRRPNLEGATERRRFSSRATEWYSRTADHPLSLHPPSLNARTPKASGPL